MTASTKLQRDLLGFEGKNVNKYLLALRLCGSLKEDPSLNSLVRMVVMVSIYSGIDRNTPKTPPRYGYRRIV